MEIEVFWGPRLPIRPSSAGAQSGNIGRVKPVHIFVRGDRVQNRFLVDLWSNAHRRSTHGTHPSEASKGERKLSVDRTGRGVEKSAEKLKRKSVCCENLKFR